MGKFAERHGQKVWCALLALAVIAELALLPGTVFPNVAAEVAAAPSQDGQEVAEYAACSVPGAAAACSPGLRDVPGPEGRRRGDGGLGIEGRDSRGQGEEGGSKKLPAFRI